ncbi:Protein phosphatase PhpP [bioreactor metagenome]|uniref:Protein phosphatase PhpP n=2 Tax=root TaxID=1 RepID=A0A645J501_9ZZZZ
MPQVEPELSHWLLQQGDRILLCSDGLTDMLSDASLESLFEENLPLARLKEALIEAANAAGGKDNIGVVLIEQDA